ncbi:tetratricopeptide repeat protein [Planctomycetaceae bacterium SH139]
MRLLWYRFRVYFYNLRLRFSAEHATEESRGARFYDWIRGLSRVFIWLPMRGRDLFGSLIDATIGGQRSLKDLLFGAPALIAIVGIATVTFGGQYAQQSSQQRYWRAGQIKLRDGDPQTAKLYLSKALSVSAQYREEITFGLAQAAEAEGDLSTMQTLMTSLASPGVTGYPSAHRYLAITMGSQIPEAPTPEYMEAWRWHLTHADQSESAKFQKFWGYYSIVVGDFPAAAIHLRKAAKEEPVLWLQVAEVESRTQNFEAVRSSLSRAEQFFRSEFQRDTSDSRNRLLYATTLFYMGALDEAGRILRQGLEADDENIQFRELLAAVMIRQYDAVIANDAADPTAFSLLALSLEYAPTNEAALRRLIQIACASPENLGQARRTARQVISSGKATAMAHFVLGSLEWIAGNQKLAELSMRQAIALDEGLGEVANNLAYLMLNEEEPNLDAALQLANQALASAPVNPSFLDTRAEILLAMGRLEEAAVDFLQALPNTQIPDEVRAKLADIYDRLEDPETATAMRAQIQAADSTP